MSKFISANIILFALLGTQSVIAQNPIIQTIYTADPAPMVHNDTLFLYVGHDEDNAPNNNFLMREYSLFTTTDMVNWTAHPVPLKTSEFKWSLGDASAAEVIERNGKFYWYISSLNRESPGVSVGVAVSVSPYGPFKDALGKALVTNNMTTFADHSWDDLDPSAIIDDDGQAFLFWGNNACYWAKLNDDMISLDGEITALDIFDESVFGPDFEEAPWMYKRNGTYYMIYASHVVEDLRYTTNDDIEGPWTYGGLIMPHEGNSGSNHPAVINYKGNDYLFYHTAALPGGGDFNRSVEIEQFEYGEDGSIPEIEMGEQGVTEAVGTLNPFKRTEAETIAWSEGLKIDENEEIGVYLTSIHNGDYLKVRDVDFGDGYVSTFKASVSSRYFGGNIELRLDSPDGDSLGVLTIPYLGDWDDWRLVETDVKKVSGIHDVFLIFKGREPMELFRFDYWIFTK
ncbi:MAG: glycoside hydrolase family 43 protein [Bacteroidales bacterium]